MTPTPSRCSSLSETDHSSLPRTHVLHRPPRSLWLPPPPADGAPLGRDSARSRTRVLQLDVAAPARAQWRRRVALCPCAQLGDTWPSAPSPLRGQNDDLTANAVDLQIANIVG